MGASQEMKENIGASSILHYEILMDAKKCGIAQYDLWGVAKDEADPRDLWHGISRFKSQFGGERLELAGAYDAVMNENLYALFSGKYERIGAH